MNRQWLMYGVTGLATLVILVAYVWFGYAPLARQLGQAKQRLVAADKAYQEEESLVARSDEFSERASKLRMEKERLAEQMPSTVQMSALLKSITLAATACRFKDIKLTPLAQEEKEGYAIQPIKLSATCRYHALGEFISEITDLSRVINPQVLEIKSKDSTGRGDSITATLMLVTYVKR